MFCSGIAQINFNCLLMFVQMLFHLNVISMMRFELVIAALLYLGKLKSIVLVLPEWKCSACLDELPKPQDEG